MGIKIIDLSNNSKVVSHRNYSKGIDRAHVFRPTSSEVQIEILKAAFYGLTGAKKYKYGHSANWVKKVKKGEYTKLSRPTANNRSITCDCTGFVTAVCKCAGVTSATRCGSYDKYMNALCKSGHLKRQSFKAGSGKLKPGDVCVRKDSTRGHAWIYVGNVKKADVLKGNVPSNNTTNTNTNTTNTNNSQPRKYTGQLPDLVLHGRELISYLAIEMSYPLGTSSSKYKLGSGKRRPLYDKALKQVWGNERSRWKYKASREGASCDVGAATIIRYSGVDKNISHALATQLTQVPSHKQIWQKTNVKSSKNMEPGDLGLWNRNGPGGHAYVCAKKGVLAESSFTNQYFLRLSKNHTSAGSSMKEWVVYRSIKALAIRKGDETAQVKKLKQFLNWFGNYGLDVSNPKCNEKTENAIKNFQKKMGLKQDGIFGSAELKKAGGKLTATGDSSASSGSYGGTAGVDSGGAIILDSIETLYSTDKYQWFTQEEQESEAEKARKEKQELVKSFLSNISVDISSGSAIAPSDVSVNMKSIRSSAKFEFKPEKFAGKDGTASLTSYPNFVEAPVIILNLNGITIGGYGNVGDKYPNYISSMTVQKINGKINRYNINLVHQIRPGEDPNFIDSLLSRTNYTNPLRILYGDSSSPGMMFREDCAVITDVKSNASVSSLSISYNIQALSSITSANQSYFNFKNAVSKPSTVLNKLLYESGQISSQILSAFPAMRDRSFVSSNNLIPNTDSVVTIGGMVNASVLDYIGHVVSCMTNDIKNSSYFLTYNDSSNGAYFKVSEISQMTDTNVLYKVDVGYPGDNFVTNFQLCDNIYWPLVYEYNDKIPKWNYSIDDSGNVLSSKSNSLLSDNRYLNDSIINSNWWKSLTEFPIAAKLTLKGLTVPTMLMTYIRVNTLFYGQKDIASGIYVVTDQTDSVSGNGYSTTLTLLRVGN